MTPDGASIPEMPENPTSPGPAIFDRLLEHADSAALPAQLTALAGLLAAASAPGMPGELTGEAAALKMFAAHAPALAAAAASKAASQAASKLPGQAASKAAGQPAGRHLAAHTRLLRLTPRLGHHLFSAAGGKVALAAGVVAVSGFTAAGYAAALPAPLQSFAHDVIGAPAPSSHHGGHRGLRAVARPGTGRPVRGAGRSLGVPSTAPTTGPSPRPVGTQLCVSWLAGGLPVHSTAYASLEKAAGGAAEMNAYCRTEVAGRPVNVSKAPATAHPARTGQPPSAPAARSSARAVRSRPAVTRAPEGQHATTKPTKLVPTRRLPPMVDPPGKPSSAGTAQR